MQRVVPYLHIASRVLAIGAALAGLAAGLLANTLASFICFDTCLTAEGYFSRVGQGAAQLLTPCVALAALALFLSYCLANRQPWRALIVVLFFLVGGLLGFAALNALAQYGQATIPVNENGLLVADPVVAWAQQWALAILLSAVVWSGGLTCLEWARRWGRLDQRSLT